MSHNVQDKPAGMAPETLISVLSPTAIPARLHPIVRRVEALNVPCLVPRLWRSIGSRSEGPRLE